MRLLVGLGDSIPDEEERKKHIIENMLYMSELNPNNTLVCKRVFCGDKYKLNLYEGDSLKLDVSKEWGIERFDIIIGNPPFNDETNETNKTNKQLWTKFILKSLDILHIDGYLGFINPQNWRAPENKLWEIMSNKQITYLHIYGAKSSSKLFNVSTKVDIYILQNQLNTEDTLIIDEIDSTYKLNLKQFQFLPNFKIKEINKIITNNNGINIIHNSFYSTTQTSETKKKFEVISSITDGNLLHYRYTDDNSKGHFGVPKVIVNGGRFPYPYNDFKGEFGMTQNLFGIPITSKTQGDDIVKAINTDEFQEILRATKWGAFQIDYRMFRYFRPDFYKSFL